MTDFPAGMARFVSGPKDSDPIFEPGKTYEIVMIISGGENNMTRVVESYDHPMLKFADTTFETGSLMMPAGGVVRGEYVNVTSPNFVSAVLVDQVREPLLRIDLSSDDDQL